MNRFHNKASKLIALLSILICLLGIQAARAEDDPTLLLSLKSDDESITINVLPPKLLEATVTISGTFQNMKGTRLVPFTMDLSAVRQDFRKPFVIFKAIAKDPQKETSWDWLYEWQPGIRGGVHNDNIAYYLPYHPMEMHAVSQGYGGMDSHMPGTDDEFAIDFDMPEGNVICAARPGLVVAVRTDSTQGGPSAEFASLANYVVIKHDDGTYARYLHLRPGGSMVKIGEMVQARQPIALAGSTGQADGSHLHFDVYVPASGKHRRSLPVRFITRAGVMPLQEGMSY